MELGERVDWINRGCMWRHNNL